MSEKKIYEIVQSFSDQDNLRNDLDEAFTLASKHFRDKYMGRLDNALNMSRKNFKQNPTKEMQLINALRPFLPTERHEKLDSISEMLTLLSTFESIRREANTATLSHLEVMETDSAIHEDGIYEVDENCLHKKSMGQVQPVQELNAAQIMLIMGLFNQGGLS